MARLPLFRAGVREDRSGSAGRAGAGQVLGIPRPALPEPEPPNSGALTDEALVGYARQLGLDVEQFEESLTSGEYEGVVQGVFREAQDAGIQGTPSFDINGQRLVGPQSVETFEQIIEQERRRAENG